MDNYVYGNGYERLMEIKMTKASKQAVVSTIYNTSVKTKSQLRAEGEKALAKFLKAGGTIEVAKPSRKKHKATMASKTTRFVSGTSGFANGFPKRSFGS